MQKYNLLFDGTILYNEFMPGNARSGIFFTTKNIFHQILKSDALNVSLYVELAQCQFLKKYLEKYNLQNKIEIINAEEFDDIYRLKSFFRKLKSTCDKKKHPLKRTFFNISFCLTSIFCFMLDKISSHKKVKEKLKQIDIYFSPCRKTPKIIKDCENIMSSVFLYDTIPLIFPEYYPRIFTGKDWYRNLIKSFNENELYFSDSECTKQDFLRFFKQLSPEQITVAPLAASEAFKRCDDSEKLKTVKEKYNMPSDKKYIFSLCTLEPRKNLIRAVKTFIEFIKKNNIDDLVFVLGGSHWNNFIEKLAQEVNNLGDYKDKIIRAGYIDDEDLPVLYSGAEWFVFTSQYEGFGLPPLEAMSCGCPVITSNTSSIPEVVGDAGIMIDWDNDEQHIEAYEKYYFNPELRKENAQKGLERAKLFSWEKCANIIIDKLIEQKNKIK